MKRPAGRPVVFALNYGLTAGAAGRFAFQGSLSNILKHNFVRFPGDPQIDYLGNPFYSTEFKTKENVSVTWDLARFGTTLYVERYGRSPNNVSTLTVAGFFAPGAGNVGAWTVANLSARYELQSGLTLSANVDNVFNRAPPVDNTYDGLSNQPYNIFNYNDYGRSYFVGASYKFDR